MKGTGKLLRIFIGESDHWHGKPLYQAIVEKARELGLAGATVTRGLEGYGKSSVVHTTRFLRMSEDLPLIIEMVDSEDKIMAAIPSFDEMIGEGLVTMETVEILLYRGGPVG